jgi:hypothetical protein
MRGQGRSSAVTGERHDGRAPFGVHLSCTIEIVTRLCPDGDAPWRACSWVCVSGPAARARASRRGAWSCEFSSSMGAGMWSPRTPRTRRACLGGGGGARLSSVDHGARASPGGRSILNFDARRSVLLCCCRRTERERVERPVLLDRARLWSMRVDLPATRLSVTRAPRPLK